MDGSSTEAVPPKQPTPQPSNSDDVTQKVVTAIQQVTADTIQKAAQVAVEAMNAAGEIMTSLDREMNGGNNASHINGFMESGRLGVEGVREEGRRSRRFKVS